MTVSRRDLLKAGIAATAACVAIPRFAFAIGPRDLFHFARLSLGTSATARAGSLERLAWELAKRTAVATDLTSRTVTLRDQALHHTPFLYLTGDREFPMPTVAEIERLRRFLTVGGFLVIDSAEGTTGGAFDGAVRQLIQTLYPLPAPGLEIVPSDHVVYRSFYRLDRPLGRVAVSPVMEGVFRDGRLQVAYIQNDLGGAWVRDDFGNYTFPCHPGGERQREMAFRLGVNLVMYALCLDYKSDQVHVEYLMRKRRFTPNDGAEDATK